jgi:hypothetical protein
MFSLARPFKHTEFNLFTHTFKYTDGTGVSYYLRGVAVSPALHVFKCRCRVYICVCVCVCEYVSIYLSIYLYMFVYVYIRRVQCLYMTYTVHIFNNIQYRGEIHGDTGDYPATNMILVCSKTGGY